MTNHAMQSTVELNETTKKQLTQQVKETLALSVHMNETNQKRNFTTAEMWHRNRKSRYAAGIVKRWHLS